MKVTFNTYNQNIRFASQIQMSDEAFHAKEKSILALIDDRFKKLNCPCKHDKAMTAKTHLNKANILLVEKLLEDKKFPVERTADIIKNTNRRAWNGTLDSINSKTVHFLELLYKDGGARNAFDMFLYSINPEYLQSKIKDRVLKLEQQSSLPLLKRWGVKLLDIFKRVK